MKNIMVKTNLMVLCGCDEFDKQEHGTDYYFYLDKPRGGDIHYTNNPMKSIHEWKPRNIRMETYNMDGEIIALYVNTLLNEGYEIDYRKAISKEKDGNGNIINIWIMGIAITFKLKEMFDK